VESSLADGRDWLVAGRFTVADICFAYALHLAESLPPLKDTLPEASRAYLDRCRARPAFLRAMDKQKG
jgi:glutathione S-transferase